jgi:hypothetical protein
MRPSPVNIFRMDGAEKLDQLELIAALLERDATNNRHLLNDLGYLGAPAATGKKRRPPSPWLRRAAAVKACVRSIVAAVMKVVRSRHTRAAIVAVCAFIVDFAVILAVGGAATAILAAAVLIAAPPA